MKKNLVSFNGKKIIDFKRRNTMQYMTIILFSIFSTLFAQNVNPATGWTYDQSTTQAFYILEDLHIDGVSAEGDGTAPPAAQSGDCYNNPGTCDVIGAFIDRGDGELCVGWAYGGILNGGMTIPLMGNDGYVSAFLNNGESAYLKVYDASNGSILGITPSEELPGWSNNGILTISGISAANNTFGCTDSNACNYDSDATANDGSCWSANTGCACEDGQGSDVDCNGECNGTAWVSDCGCVDEDNSGDDCDDCAGTPNGTASEDGCGVCDTDDSNDDATCTGCTNSDADNYSGPSYIFDDGSCSFTVPAATNLSAEGGPARVYLSWDAPADTFSSNAGYTYEINLVGEGLVKSTTQTSTQITGLEGGSEYCFTVLAIHNSYGLSDSDSNESCATPQEVVGPTWRLQLVATIDSYDQFKFSGEESWLLTDDQNFIGAAADGSWGYDPLHDAPEPPNGPGNYIKLFFDHPEWNEWVTHFTEDIVLDDDDFFSTNLTRWDGRVQSDVPGSTTITLHVETGQVPGNYEMYFELDGNYTRIEHDGETTIEFYMDGSGQKDFSVTIGNIPPHSPDNLTSVGLYNSIELDWDEDGEDLNDIGNRYPATSYNVYRDDEPLDPDSNSGSNDSNGPGGCGGLLTGPLGQSETDYNDDASIYADYPDEGLLQESTYSYTVTGSNNAGESSEGHTVRTSGGFDTWYSGRVSRTESTTGINADPISAPVYVMSPNGTNVCNQTIDGCDDGDWGWTSGIYEIPHNYSPDKNKIGIIIDAAGSSDSDFPYSFSENPYDFHYHWTPKSDISDVTNIVGTDAYELSFAVENHHDNSHLPDGGSKFYTWTLETVTDHPVKRFGECGVWDYEMSSNSNSADITIEIRPEPNQDPIAAPANYLTRSGDGNSVVTSDDYDGPLTGGDNDFNDYDGPEGLWYEPHNNNADNNKADLFFSAYDSQDGNGKCGGYGPPVCLLDCPGFLDIDELFAQDCAFLDCAQLEEDCDNNGGANNCWYQVDDCFDSEDSCFEFSFCNYIADQVENSDCLDDCDYNMNQEISEFLSDCTECTIDDCTTGGCEDDEIEDCTTGDCVPASALGDGWCDDQNMDYGIDLSCYSEEAADCDGNSCPTGYINDCSDTDCCPSAWIGDGEADCADQAWGCDLSCHDNDGGDCPEDEEFVVSDSIAFDIGDDLFPGSDRDIRAGEVLRKDYYISSGRNTAQQYISSGRNTAQQCDEQSYEWFWTQASAAGMEFTDENDDGIFQIGEPFTLMNSNIVYESHDLGDYVPTGMDQFGTCENCIPQYFSSDSDNLEVGEYGYEGMDLHAEFNAGIYIITLKVTDIYGDVDHTSILTIVNEERNEGPSVTDLRQQETYYISYGKDTRQTQIGGCESDNLSAADSDNDNLTFNWDYSYDAAGTSSPDGDGELAYEDGSDDSEYIHAFGALAQLGDSPDGWKQIAYDLEEGDHTFTFTTTDPYGETASTSSTIKIRREPDAAHANVSVVHEDLKYITVEVSDNNLNEPIEDECYGKVYDGDLDNTRTIELFNDGSLIEVFRQDNDGNWIADSEDAGESTFIQIDKALEAETSYHYTVQSYNDDGEIGDFDPNASSVIGRTGNRPTVTVLSPNGAEIRSVSDLFDVDFATTDPQYISKIEVFYLRDGVTEEAGTDTDGNVILSDSGVNSGGEAQGDNTNNFKISDDTGVEINYDAKVLVRVYDVGNYDGNNVQSNDDASDFPFTMAAHSISKEYGSGWHLIGTPLTPYNDELVDNLSGSFGQWGSNWVAYDVDGHYDNLNLNLGEGYYVALADSQILTQEGNPVIADPDCNDCDDNSFGLADIDLDKGWNLISNPLVNKVSKETFTLNYDGQDLEFDDAVDAGWIAPTIYGWFENSYESIERIMPFGGYFVNTSRALTLKVRPHLFDDGELTRKSEDLAQVPTLKLRASDMSGNGNSDFVIIGLLEDASDEFVYGEDEYDLPNNAYSSMGGEYIDLRIGSDLMKDMKTFDYDEYQVWNVSIKTEKVDNDINLTWGDVSGFNDALHIVINGEAINMHEKSSFELSAMIDEVAIVLGDVDAYLNPIPDEFGLGAAYPNPFNPTTNLSLALNQDGFVSMSVFNVRGQVVQTLVDRNMKAGYHNVVWNADGISSGMYFVRVEMGDNMAIQKLMLLK